MSKEFDQQSFGQRTGVTAIIKWFNPAKGFGFAQLGEGEPDAFVHASVMARAGVTNLPNGCTIVCDVSRGERGLQVSQIHSVDLSTAVATPPEAESSRPDRDEQELSGTVKFYDFKKGFGFVTPDHGERDIFVPARTLQKVGLWRLAPDQRVRLRWREDDKGLLATWIEPVT